MNWHEIAKKIQADKALIEKYKGTAQEAKKLKHIKFVELRSKSK